MQRFVFTKECTRLGFLLLVAWSSASSANDTSVAIGTGGIVPKNNKHVTMKSEELLISPDRITVTYLFENTSSKDEVTFIAFPLPPIVARDIEILITPLRSTGQKDERNIVDFSVEVDGKSVSFETEQKAMLGKKDVTKLLKRVGLPLIPWFPDPVEYEKILKSVSPTSKQEITRAKLTVPDSMNTSQGELKSEWDPIFLYEVQTQYYWKQRFPAKSTTQIRHSYIPLKGVALGPFFQGTWADEAKNLDAIGLCGSKSDVFLTKPGKDELQPCRTREEIQYIIKTARSWKGPIGDFTIKLSQMSYLFTCFDGFKRTGSDTWIFQAKNFVPKRDLQIAYCRSGEK